MTISNGFYGENVVPNAEVIFCYSSLTYTYLLSAASILRQQFDRRFAMLSNHFRIYRIALLILLIVRAL